MASASESAGSKPQIKAVGGKGKKREKPKPKGK